MPYEVSVVKCDSYDEAEVRKAVEASLAPLGGLGSVVRKGDRVLIKLNLVAAKPPEEAVTTHPAVAKAVVRLVQELGATPIIGDSPGGGSSVNSYKTLLAKTGMQKVIDETGCEMVRFDEAEVQVSSEKARTFKQFKIAKAATEADVIIGLPKLKTQALTLFTGAVKLNYGFIPGMTKVDYHLYATKDPAFFAEVLIDLHETCHPDLNIMDAVVGMEGAGPSNGDPRRIGLLLASKSCTAMDYVATTIIGFDPMVVPTVKLAYDRGLGPKGLDDITVYDEKVEPLIIGDFKKAATAGTVPIPAFLMNPLKNLLVYRPRIDPAECKRCGDCAKNCPPKAIRCAKGSVPAIDKNKCIRCYCCQELCPVGAVKIHTPALRKMLNR